MKRHILTIFLLCRIRQRWCLCETGPQKTRHLSWYVSTVFMSHTEHMALMNTTCNTYSGFMCALAVRLLVQRKQGRTSEVAQRPLPVFCPFFHSLSFYQEDWPSPLLHLLILISSSTLKSQIKTAMEAEQPYEAEMKVNLRDVSVDKNPPSSSFCWSYYF